MRAGNVVRSPCETRRLGGADLAPLRLGRWRAGRAAVGVVAGVGAITVAQYANDPTGPPSFSSNGKYFDVEMALGSTFTSITVDDCNLSGGTTPADSFTVTSIHQITALSPAGSGTVPVTVTNPAGTTAAATSDQFTYATAGVSPSPVPSSSYWEVTTGGDVYSFGDATFTGSTGNLPLNQPIVDIATAEQELPRDSSYDLVSTAIMAGSQ